eukprot:COSAG01_NODE_13811_length_1532_cov_1.205862_2_plen_347_part_01
MFASSRDREHAWFNVIHPAASGTKPLRSNEMRHVVDFFSMIFGLCGVKTNSAEGDVSSPCISLSVQKREQLSRFFHQELATVDWIRATSPQCNCSHSFAVPDDVMTSGEWSAQAPRPSRGADDASWPGLVSCKANREDHGTTGAYSAWPALAAEALCYLEGNCSSAFRVMASFAPNTYQGAFGQANAVNYAMTFDPVIVEVHKGNKKVAVPPVQEIYTELADREIYTELAAAFGAAVKKKKKKKKKKDAEGRTQSGKQVLRAEAVNIAGLAEKIVDGKVHYQMRVFADDGKGQKIYWTVFKRYSDFNTLRSEVDAKWGGPARVGGGHPFPCRGEPALSPEDPERHR